MSLFIDRLLYPVSIDNFVYTHIYNAVIFGLSCRSLDLASCTFEHMVEVEVVIHDSHGWA